MLPALPMYLYAHGAEVDVKTELAGSPKLGWFQKIEGLCPELHAHGLAWFEGLFHRHVEVDKLGPNYGMSSQVAIGPGIL